MEPILAALTSEEIAEALRDYVLRKNAVAPTTRVVAQVSYNTKGGSLIAAVSLALHETPEERAGV
jgi:hypothetical protein